MPLLPRKIGISRRTVFFLSIFMTGWFLWLGSARLEAMERVVVCQEGKSVTLEGRSLVEAKDGGRLFLTRGGEMFPLTPSMQSGYTKDDRPFAPYDEKEFQQRVLAKLPPGFEVRRTAHYLIFFETSRAYAQWCGSLFERLYMAFTNFWKRQKVEIKDPEFPLVAVIFNNKRSFDQFSREELGDAVRNVIGYYNLRSNWMVMSDLTGLSMEDQGTRIRTSKQIDKILSQPQGAMIVTTIVHEATHQIAYNCGMHERMSDIPLWFVEGIAQFFETPDLRSAKGWRGIGAVNEPRLSRFLDYMDRRPADSLKTLFIDDQRFRNSETALDAYAEAWALTYFLIRQRNEQYVEYVRRMSQHNPMVKGDSEKRLKELRKVFGDLNRLHSDFIRYYDRMR